jgi:hypothetical protein
VCFQKRFRAPFGEIRCVDRRVLNRGGVLFEFKVLVSF